MLKKSRRLTKKDFNDIYDRGENHQLPVGYVKVAPIAGVSRFSCVAAKKNVRTSVDRTRIRRRGYAALETYRDELPDGVGVIWFLPREALDCNFSLLTAAVGDLKKLLE